MIALGSGPWSAVPAGECGPGILPEQGVERYERQAVRKCAGGPAAETIAGWILEQGAEPVVSLSLAAHDKTQALARARAWCAAGVRNLLVVTGDYPIADGRERAVYDIDSVQALMLLQQTAQSGDGFPADVNKGCVVAPFKRLESELMWQYEKLRRKVEVGADFIVSQAGFDPAPSPREAGLAGSRPSSRRRGRGGHQGPGVPGSAPRRPSPGARGGSHHPR